MHKEIPEKSECIGSMGLSKVAGMHQSVKGLEP